MDLQILLDALLSLIPPALVGVLFYVIMRGIFRADSTERKIYARMEAEMREAQESKGSAAQVAKAETVKNTPKSAPKTTPKVSKTTKK
jgi:hypothetical protein